MLLDKRTLQRVVDGEVELAFRRWKRPTVRAGGTLRTRAGVLAIEAIDRVALREITAEDARRAGHESRAALLDALRDRDGDVYRIALRFAGADPRIALRQTVLADADDFRAVERRLERMDTASRAGPWTVAYLELIRDNEAVRAPDLAAGLGLETRPFKARVRRLKELGLTESLEVGYRLSPRGRSFVRLRRRRKRD